jgi:hypothetical protein
MGYLRGVYGPNSHGEKVFFGKWIGQGGNFKGMLRGHYGAYDARPGGWFEGAWLGSSLRVKGKVRGSWMTNDNGGGNFRGTWRRACNSSLRP